MAGLGEAGDWREGRTQVGVSSLTIAIDSLGYRSFGVLVVLFADSRPLLSSSYCTRAMQL